MGEISGHCLCGAVTFETDAEPVITANCHCDDCRQVTGAAYATMAFVPKDQVTVTGTVKTFSHKVESGNTLTKSFCPNCGAQMYTENTGRENLLGLRAGVIAQKEAIKPQFNVFVSSKIPSTPLDPNIPAHDKMPG